MKWKTMKLSEEEVAAVMAMRKLRKAEAEGETVPPELMEHGFVSVKRAAELLGVPVAEFERAPSSERPPVLKGGRVPISELRREHHRRHLNALRDLARAASSLADGGRYNSVIYDELWMFESRGFFAENIARELNMSLRAAQRLMKAELFGWRDKRNRPYVTPEEFAAFKRKRETVAVAA